VVPFEASVVVLASTMGVSVAVDAALEAILIRPFCRLLSVFLPAKTFERAV